MDIIKHALIDLMVKLFILVAVLTQAAWMWWVVIVYTSLMLILKLVDYSGAGFSSFKKTARPMFRTGHFICFTGQTC